MKTYPHTFSGRRASQSEYELSSLIDLLKKHDVKRYLEIGAREGDTFHEIVTKISPDYALAVDLPGGLWGKITTKSKLIECINDLKEKKHNVEMFLGKSSSDELLYYVKNIDMFDAIFIDGDHTLEGVRKDWENYKNLSNIIIFHDIVGYNEKEKTHNNKVEVPILWQELKTKYEHIEFVDENSSMGIGVIFI